MSTLPPWFLRTLAALALLPALAALALSATQDSRRESRVLDEAERACRTRQAEAEEWLAGGVEVEAEIERLTARRGSVLNRMLLPDDEGGLGSELEALATLQDLEGRFRLGTLHPAGPVDSAPASLGLRGDRANLPPLMQAFYSQRRAVRLLSLRVELPRFDGDEIEAVLRWEYAAPTQTPPQPEDPTARWAPPRFALAASVAAVSSSHPGAWAALDEAAVDLRGLWPALRRLATRHAELQRLRDEAATIERWRDDQEAEARAVQRKLPLLLGEVDKSPVGRALLKVGAGGRLAVEREG